METSVLEWLNGNRNYEAGLQLLRDHNASEFLIDLLSSGPDHYNTPRLLQEIQNLPQTEIAVAADWATGHVVVMEAATGRVIPPAPPELPPYNPDDDLEKKLRIDAQIRQLFKEMTHLHGKLLLVPEGEELYQVARELMIRNAKKQDLFDQLHYFKTNGKWFSEIQSNPRPENLEQEIKNAMARRSKASAFLKKPLPVEKKDFYERKVAAITTEIENLQSLRNG